MLHLNMSFSLACKRTCAKSDMPALHRPATHSDAPVNSPEPTDAPQALPDAAGPAPLNAAEPRPPFTAVPGFAELGPRFFTRLAPTPLPSPRLVSVSASAAGLLGWDADAATQRSVLERIHRVLKPGGMLFVGHAENFSESRDLFTLRGKTVYERR